MAEYEHVSVGPWPGGVNYSLPTEDVPVDQLATMQNCRIGAAGQVEKRPGTASYGGREPIGGGPTLTSCGEFRESNGTATRFITAGNKFYEYVIGSPTPANDVWTDRTASITITAGDDNTFEWAYANGTLVLTNGVNPPVKWTGAGTDITALNVSSRFTTAEHVAFWDNRVWMANTNADKDRVWHSDIAGFETWGATSFYNIGSLVTALVPMQNGLSVHTLAGIWMLIPTGNATTPYQLQQRTQQAGAGGRSAVTLPGGIQLFIREDGIYRWEGGDEVVKASRALDHGYWADLNQSRISDSFAVYFPRENEVHFFLCNGAAQVQANHVMVYNMGAGDDADPFWWGPSTGMTYNCAALIANKPHAGDFDGYLQDLETGTQDATKTDKSIDAFFKTGSQAEDDEAVTSRRWLFARCYFDDKGDYDVTCDQTSPGLTGKTSALRMGSGAGALGGFTMDADVLGAGSKNKPAVVYGDIDLQGYDAHSSLVVTNNSADEPFTFRHFHLVHKDIGKRRKRKIGVEI